MESYFNRSESNRKCSDKQGSLPECGLLAVGYVPIQEPGPKYKEDKALTRGTLFPGLDLPYRNMEPSKDAVDSPLGELMALDFAIHELGLYLDTHQDDAEALKLYNLYVKMSKEGTEKYEELYGPLRQHTVYNSKYTWLKGPWPWERTEGRGEK